MHAAPDADRNDVAARLAELEEQLELGVEAADSDSTAADLKAELDTILEELKRPAVADFENESACGRVTEMVKSIGQDAADLSAEFDAARAEAKSPTSALGNLGQYTLLAKLGEGGMGTVYKARHTRLDKVVALKVLPPERMRDAQAVARFEREMRAVGKLDHPHIVRAMDAGEVNGTRFLVMEYVKGVDLSQVLRETGPLPVADACEIIRQAALGLEEAHADHMVHRDIKPGNLILASRRRKPPIVKILDMGLALLSEAHTVEAQELTTTGQMMGTLDYMAPEQSGDSKQVDIRADIYALGASLYKLLTGEPVYHGQRYQTAVQKMMALATEPAPPIQQRREGITPELASIVHRMLEKDPAKRFATPEEVATALAPYCQGADLAKLLAACRSNIPSVSDHGASATLPSLPAPETGTEPTIDCPSDHHSGAAHAQDEPHPSLPARRRLHNPATCVTARKAAGAKWRLAGRPLGVAVALAGMAALLAAFVFFVQTPQGTLRVEIDDPQVEVRVKDTGIVLQRADKEEIQIAAGEKTLVVTRGDFQLQTRSFILQEGETTTVKVEYLPGEIRVVQAGEVIGSQSLESSGEEVAEPKAGFGLRLGKDDTYVQLPTLPEDLPPPLTVEGYLSLDEAAEAKRGKYVAVQVGGLQLGIDRDANAQRSIVLFANNLDPRGYVSLRKKEIAPGRWYHVAATWDGKQAELFVDGQSVGQDTLTTPKRVENRLGVAGVRPWYLLGSLDEVRVSSTIRYKENFFPSPRFEADEKTLVLYHCDEGSGKVLHDASGNDRHGLIVDAEWIPIDGR